MASTIALLRQLKDNLARTRREGVRFRPDVRKIIYPFRVLNHPVTAFTEVKYEKAGSMLLANIILVLFFIESIVDYVSTGFTFNLNKPTDVNIWLIFSRTVVIVALWVVASWAMGTFMDGEGKVREIWITTCYTLMPQVLLILPRVLLSNVLTIEESAFLTILSAVTGGWTILLLCLSVMVVQQYSLVKTILAVTLNAAGVIIIMFLAVLFFSLFQQFFTFLMTIYREASFRM